MNIFMRVYKKTVCKIGMRIRFDYNVCRVFISIVAAIWKILIHTMFRWYFGVFCCGTQSLLELR